MNEAQGGGWSAADLLLGARFLAGAVSYLRRPLDVDQARSIVRHRVRNRDAAFLDLVKRGVYEHAPSPYLPLLRAAGCEYGDLDRLVGTDGLEGALLTHILAQRHDPAARRDARPVEGASIPG